MTLNSACAHKIAQHEHGTHASYVLDRCRCDDCRAAVAAYNKSRNQWLGEFPTVAPPLVSNSQARAHILNLMNQGMGHKRISQVAGVPASAVGAIIWGRWDRTAVRIRRETEAALLAVTLELADGQKVPATEANLIVTELVNRGWTKAAIGRHIHDPGSKSLQISRRSVFVSTVKTLRRLLREPVPQRVHNATGRTYQPNRDYIWRDVPETTRGVPTVDYGFPEWLRQLDRQRLQQTVQESIRNHGVVA